MNTTRISTRKPAGAHKTIHAHWKQGSQVKRMRDNQTDRAERLNIHTYRTYAYDMRTHNTVSCVCLLNVFAERPRVARTIMRSFAQFAATPKFYRSSGYMLVCLRRKAIIHRAEKRCALIVRSDGQKPHSNSMSRHTQT